MTSLTRHAHRAPRPHFGPSAFCTGYTLFTRKQRGKRPPRRRAMSARLRACWTFGAIWEGERTILGCV